MHTGVAGCERARALASILGRYDDPAELEPELLENAGLQVVQQLSGQAGMIAQTVAQVIAAAVWAFDVAAPPTSAAEASPNWPARVRLRSVTDPTLNGP